MSNDGFGAAGVLQHYCRWRLIMIALGYINT
jgi:hypothetical protein